MLFGIEELILTWNLAETKDLLELSDIMSVSFFQGKSPCLFISFAIPTYVSYSELY